MIDYKLPPPKIIDNLEKREMKTIEVYKYYMNNIKNNKGIFFKIEYDKNLQKYFLKDMGYGFGTFILINNILIKENNIINIGDSYIVFSFKMENDISTENESNDESIYLKIYNGKRTYEPIIIKSKFDKKLYTIGRSENSDLMIEDNMLSREHCFIYYDKNNWYIKDGNKNGGSSTNGTWLFAYEPIEILNEMVFKSNSYNFGCKLTNEKK